MISEENSNFEKIRKLGKVLLSLIVFIGVIYCSFSLYFENERLRQEEERLKIEEERLKIEEENLIKQGYCPKTKTILTKEELYQTAMRDFLKDLIDKKNKIAIEYDIDKNELQYYNIWVGEPINGKKLRDLIDSVIQEKDKKTKETSIVHLYEKIFRDRFKDTMFFLNVENISNSQLSPKNNAFNIYWNVIWGAIYAYDCCTVYTPSEAIEQTRILKVHKHYAYEDEPDDIIIKRYSNAHYYFYYDSQDVNSKGNAIKDNAYEAYSRFVPIDTCGHKIPEVSKN